MMIPSAKPLLLLILSGYLLILLVRFKTRDDIEKTVFDDLAASVRGARPNAADDSLVIEALHQTHWLLQDRANLFRYHTGYNNSLTDDVLTAAGACGSYADVLCALLRRMGYKVRIAQMKVKNIYGGHNLVEAATNKGWVVLDATFDQYFITPDGGLASFDDVHRHWMYYRRQLHTGYDTAYNYAGVRYTNWQKIPVLLPTLHRLLTGIIGERRTDTISLRPFFLRKYYIYCLLLYAAMALLLILLKGRILLLPFRYLWQQVKTITSPFPAPNPLLPL